MFLAMILKVSCNSNLVSIIVIVIIPSLYY